MSTAQATITAAPATTTTTAAAPPVHERKRFSLGTAILYTALTGLAIVFCLPFVWLVLTSLKPPAEVFSSTWLPSERVTASSRRSFSMR